MAYQKNREAESYDIFPRVVAAGADVCIHIRPLGVRREFEPGEEYTLTIAALTTGRPRYFPLSADYRVIIVRCDEEGCFTFHHVFEKEQEYYLRLSYIHPDTGKTVIRQGSIYCVADDLIGRYPFMGDLHVHTCCSDGNEQPETVCAAYRKHGYDFMTISDHHRYYPSLRAMEFYREVPTELTIVPGEEVHMIVCTGEICDVHIVNFGGEYSVNALVEGPAIAEKGKEEGFRSIGPDCPPVMSQKDYYELMQERASKLVLPAGVDPLCTASVSWVFEQIRRGNGLGILAHPFWFNDVQNIPDRELDYIIENHMMDAVEILGGDHYYAERYREQNRLQAVRYSDDRARGLRYPIVGSSDSHSCLSTNPDAFMSSTIVFARENEREEIISAVKNFYSVAIDNLCPENYHIIGELRLARYCNFLLKYYFPLHDELCFEEGRLMQQYAVGTEEEKQEALEELKLIHGRVARMREKYFDFGD